MRTNGKRLWIGILAVLIALLMAAGCVNKAEEGEEPVTEGPDETPTYRVDPGDKAGAFVDLMERYAAGDEVVLKTHMVMDASPTVTADGEILSPRVSEDYRYLLYTFTMPAHDVVVTYSLGRSDMERQFSITYEGDALRVIDPVYMALPHDIVTIRLGLIFDVVTYVRVNGRNAEQVDGPDDGYLYFQFVMPAEDVVVQIESNNISVVDGEPVMMIDYYETATAIIEESGEEEGYFELVLYDDQNASLLLVEYRNGGTPNETETEYRVPQDVLIEALNVIYGARMDTWNDMADALSLDGALYVCRYNAGGAYCRVSSEAMPEDGMEAFSALRALLCSYLTDDYRA